MRSIYTDRNWSESELSSPLGDQTIDCLPPPTAPRSSTMEDEMQVLSLLKDVISYHDNNMSSWIIENKVKTLINSCKNLSKHHRENVIEALATTYSVDHDKIYQALNQFKSIQKGSTISAVEERQLKEVLTPLYIWLFKIVGRLEGGVKFLVDLRIDLLDMLHRSKVGDERFSSLQQLNANLKDLLTLWFSVGFLQLERVTWRSPCEMLQKISEYEAVHPVRNWTDLKRRVGPYRRCFVYTHSSMPSEPIVVLHTALCAEISSSTKGIIAATQQMTGGNNSLAELTTDSQVVEDPSRINTAIFYSVTSTQPGLQGIELGNYLIKRVVQELQAEFPQITQFSTLSPIPSFKKWLLNKLESLEKDEGDTILLDLWTPVVPLFGGWKELKKHLHSNTWVKDSKLISNLENPLMITCAYYLYREKRKGMALDNVANFHLKNGAVMWRLNWLADTSPRGMTNSCGLMVNYRYFLEDAENNSRDYLQNKTIKTSEQIEMLAGKKVTSKL
ncbi:hypothetical protein GE061_016517 [Apolygus lucorum]|uniref:Malonyl-CoA decarboxylase C-terminal domain-containing protein n=1 Tax=Apolygus lucorum TaxID=248454 RepID=A0A6A4J4T4_APOLU|nr:hypothetical protein GE061_016517 [Apolygus lucorum]